ncbi:MAG: hypothetical protein Q9214_004347, partial [Letrouitia sp. 1 TL-2023]
AISWPFLHETNEDIYKSASKATATADEAQPKDTAAREPLLKRTPTVAIAGVVPRYAAWYCIFGVGCISFHAILFDEIYPIFAASAHHHGLQFTSSNIAVSLSIMGPIICLAQLVLYPMLNDRFSSLTL